MSRSYPGNQTHQAGRTFSEVRTDLDLQRYLPLYRLKGVLEPSRMKIILNYSIFYILEQQTTPLATRFLFPYTSDFFNTLARHALLARPDGYPNVLVDVLLPCIFVHDLE
jgi:hypothetical protein